MATMGTRTHLNVTLHHIAFVVGNKVSLHLDEGFGGLPPDR